VLTKADVRWQGKQAYDEVVKQVFLPRVDVPSDIAIRFRGVRRLSVMVPMRDGVRLATDIYLPTDPVDGGPSPVPDGSDGPRLARAVAGLKAAARGNGRLAAGAPAGTAPGRPAAPAGVPALVVRQPYGKREAFCAFPVFGRYWARRGYAFVVQDVRGRWASEDEYDPFVHEFDDGFDTVDWVSRQPWCNGSIGPMGESYYGYTTWCMALSGHPAVKAAAPGDTTVDMYQSAFRSNALCFNPFGVWALWINHARFCNYYKIDSYHLPLRMLDESCDLASRPWKLLMDHFPKDEYWGRVDLTDRLDSIGIPVLHWSGWYDQFLSQTIAHWRRCRAHRDDQYLVIGATDHLLSPERTGRIGQMPVAGIGNAHDRNCRFFDRYLKGMDTSFPAAPVTYFVLGRGEWRTAEQWPPEGVRTVDLSLGGASGPGGANAGSLAAPPPAGDAAAPAAAPPPAPSQHTYLYDPDHPVDLWVGTDGWAPARDMKDRAALAARSDVLVFDTPPLAADLEVTGPVRVRLHAASSAEDTDFIATLDDVHPGGYVHLVQQGIVRARYRDAGADEPLEPGRVYDYDIDLWSTSYVFRAGHRLRLEISSSEFDRFDRNLNVYEPWASGTRPRVARQTVWHDAVHPSCLSLSVRTAAQSTAGEEAGEGAGAGAV
jgi:putative CocE/NonD family hydrolase